MHGLAEQCVDLLGVDAVGLLVTDQRGRLQVMGASSEQTRLLELFQLQNDQGPCLVCFRSGRPVHCADLTGPQAGAWPRFAEQARLAGFRAVSAFPMRLREQVIGAMNLFQLHPGELDAGTAGLAQAMADIATIGLLQERAIRESEVLSEQLHRALDSRVVIEQAKGMLGERHALPMDEAFTLLRSHARSSHQNLTDLARSMVTRTTDLQPSDSDQGSPAPPEEHRPES
ncbi:GAF and ANTAR domain-containing protein [Nonomuraea zeae]|uniref:GAF and ANTAR domain-containing protein n=2 Tax=Nonomuraea zeae TaxID=1642303 RepID=A0A5S4GT43_9ACTN|nr:GAF and ANTAR domain-containing protein [Nonomuraea zeae]